MLCLRSGSRRRRSLRGGEDDPRARDECLELVEAAGAEQALHHVAGPPFFKGESYQNFLIGFTSNEMLQKTLDQNKGV